MGSVGDDYQCPHCDVVGKGGYPIDGIGYPICTGDAANCLDKVAWAWTRAMVKHEALLMVLCVRHPMRGAHATANPSVAQGMAEIVGDKIAFSCDIENLICLQSLVTIQSKTV